MLALALYIHSAHRSFLLPTISVSRLDKEFVGPFGLLLPDVTQLPATFDVLLANLQVSWSSPPSAAASAIAPVPAPAPAPAQAPAPGCW